MGRLGTFGPGSMIEGFDDVCWDLPLDTVSLPVKSNRGYHLIMVEDREIPKGWKPAHAAAEGESEIIK